MTNVGRLEDAVLLLTGILAKHEQPASLALLDKFGPKCHTIYKTDSSSQTFGLDERHSMHADIECNSNGTSIYVYHPASQVFYSLIQTAVVFHVINRDGNSSTF